MTRLIKVCFIVGAISFSAWLANSHLTVAAEGGDTPAVLQADNALQLALKDKNTKRLGASLDQDFTWTDEEGHTRKRAEFLRDAATGSGAADTSYADLKARDYGQLAIVTGMSKRTGHPDTFFARIWVKRPGGWMLLTHQDTPILSKDSPSPKPAAPSTNAPASSECDNPCRSLPYKPQTEGQKEIVKAYQDVETAVTSHDAKTWAYHVADEFVGIGRRYFGEPDTKAGRVGQIGIVSNKVVLPQMLRGEAYVFGDAGILIADHQPIGEPPYHVIRVWVNRDGRWQLFHRQETTIKQAQ